MSRPYRFINEMKGPIASGSMSPSESIYPMYCPRALLRPTRSAWPFPDPLG